MSYPELITLITILIYACATVSGIYGMLSGNPLWKRLGCHFALAAFFCQTLALISGFHKSPSGFLSTGAWLQLPAWFILLCGAGAWWRLRHDVLLLFAAPFCLALFLMSLPWLNSPVALPSSLSSSFFIMHTGAIFLAIGMLCVAFISGCLFLALEKRVKKRRKMPVLWHDLPSLALLDRINAVCILAAFPLYTLGIITGLIWASPVYGQTLSGDFKEYVSLLIWILLSIVFHNRLAAGWRGRKPAQLAIVIFVLSIISMVVLNFILPGHHAFGRS